MSFSDFILAILVLAGTACILWVYDINPYSTKLYAYTQTCDNMILDNTYCKGNWVDDPTSIFLIDQESSTVTHSYRLQSNQKVYSKCSIVDRKNWVCTDDASENNIEVKGGKLIFNNKSDIRQITRLEWLQNKLLEKIS